MTTRKRRLLFLGFFALFLLIGFGIICFSLGWRIDFDNFAIRKTGAISIKTHPRSTIIKINNKLYPNKSSLIQSETLVTSLLPKVYNLQIEKVGYYPYQKYLKVEPSMVSRALNILLIPEKITLQDFFDVRGNFISSMTPDENKFIIKKDSDNVFYLYDKKDSKSTVNINALINTIKGGVQPKKMEFVPFQPEQIIIEDATGLKLLDTKKKTYETIYKGTILVWDIQSPNIFFIISEISKTQKKEEKKSLVSYNLIFKTQETLFDFLEEAPPFDALKIKSGGGNGKIAILDSKNDLFIYDRNLKTFLAIASDIKDFAFSPDNKKIAALKIGSKNSSESGDALIYFLENFDSDIQKKAGDITYINLSPWGVTDKIQWYKNSYHLLGDFNGELKIFEIDERAPLNVFYIQGSVSDWQYGFKNDILYIIKAGKLSAINFGTL